MAKYVKLGKKAFSFYDPGLDFSISGKQIKKSPNRKKTEKFKKALAHRHLEEATEEEFEAYQKSIQSGSTTEKVVNKSNDKGLDELSPKEKFKLDLSTKIKSELVDYYKESYEVSEDELKAFSKLNHGDMVSELVSLEFEEEN